jgi:MFS family permease
VTRSETHAPDGVGEHRTLRDYRLLLSAFVVSTAGDWLYKLALPLLVLSLTGSALQTAVVYSLEYVPYLLFAMAGGVISDRYDRRLLLIGADSAAAVLIGALAVLAWFNQYQLWSIYLAAFLLSTITPLYQASFLAILPSTVPPERLGWANSRMQAGQSALDLAGPLLGAGAVAALGARWALSLDSASFALSALAVALIVRAAAHRPERAPATVREDLRAAVRFVRDTPILLWGAIAAAGSSLGLSMIEANMLSYLVRYRHQSVAAVGVVFAALGAGALIGALLAPRIGKLANSGLVIIGSVLVGGVGTALLLVLHQLVTIAAAWVLVGASTAVFIVTFFTLRHQIVPQHLLGRVVVMTRLIAYVTVPIAPLIGGALLSATGSFAPVIVVSAVAQIGIAVVALCTPLRTASAPTPAA